MKRTFVVGVIAFLLILGVSFALYGFWQNSKKLNSSQNTSLQVLPPNQEVTDLVNKNAFDEGTQSGMKAATQDPNQAIVFGKMKNLRRNLVDFSLTLLVETKYGDFSVLADESTFFSKLSLSKPVELQYERGNERELSDGDQISVRFEVTQSEPLTAIELQQIIK